MTRYFIDWGLKTGGEFVVEASSIEAARELARNVIQYELDLEVLDADEAELHSEVDTEPVDKWTSYYRKNSEGKFESFIPKD